MGRGDKRTRRGKIFSASFGNIRKRVKKATKPAAKPVAVKAPSKAAPAAKKASAAKKPKES